MTQVITIGPDGSMSGLQRKPGQGVDLTKFGIASVKRASEIVWDDMAQAWKIDVLQEAGRGVVTTERLREVDLSVDFIFSPKDGVIGWWDSPHGAMFDNYDHAVKVEIAYLDALRLQGQH